MIVALLVLAGCATPCERFADAVHTCLQDAGDDASAWERPAFCDDAPIAWADWYDCVTEAWDRPCASEADVEAATAAAAACPPPSDGDA